MGFITGPWPARQSLHEHDLRIRHFQLNRLRVLPYRYYNRLHLLLLRHPRRHPPYGLNGMLPSRTPSALGRVPEQVL